MRTVATLLVTLSVALGAVTVTPTAPCAFDAVLVAVSELCAYAEVSPDGSGEEEAVVSDALQPAHNASVWFDVTDDTTGDTARVDAARGHNCTATASFRLPVAGAYTITACLGDGVGSSKVRARPLRTLLCVLLFPNARPSLFL
jgi:hypothetical protein